MVKVVFLSCLLCLFVAGNTGCMKCGETIAERAMEKVAEQVTGADEIKIGGGTKPVDLSDLPEFLRYPGAKATHSAKVSGDGTRHWQYHFETGDEVSKVAGWFESNFNSQGWKEPVRVESGGVIQLHYRSPDEKEVIGVTVTSEDGTTKIFVTSVREG